MRYAIVIEKTPNNYSATDVGTLITRDPQS